MYVYTRTPILCMYIYIKVFSKSSINIEHKYEKRQLKGSLDLGFSTELPVDRVNT